MPKTSDAGLLYIDGYRNGLNNSDSDFDAVADTVQFDQREALDEAVSSTVASYRSELEAGDDGSAISEYLEGRADRQVLLDSYLLGWAGGFRERLMREAYLRSSGAERDPLRADIRLEVESCMPRRS